ncbi:hypothetical protein F2981_33550 (plasmid) [Sinorhizobium meliloti]|nr:hypothetical protein [Sinorhizobium meliloti]
MRLNEAIRGSGLKIEGVAFPRSVDDLRLPLELAASSRTSHSISARHPPPPIEDCLPCSTGGCGWPKMRAFRCSSKRIETG